MSNLKFGIISWFFNKPLNKYFNLLKKFGFYFSEISLDYPWSEKFDQKVKNFQIAFHAPWEGIYIAHPNKLIKDASLKVIENCMKNIRKYNPIYFNLHLNSEAALLHYKKKNAVVERIRKIIKKHASDSLKRLAKIAKELEILITIENASHIFVKPEDFRVIKKLKLKLCFDVGHAVKHAFLISKKINWRKLLKRWVKIYRNQILTVHLHDFKFFEQKCIDHLILGQGELDLNWFFNLLKRTNCKYIVLECHRKMNGKKTKEGVTFKEIVDCLRICKEYERVLS